MSLYQIPFYNAVLCFYFLLGMFLFSKQKLSPNIDCLGQSIDYLDCFSTAAVPHMAYFENFY